jgi:hypothetical protein
LAGIIDIVPTVMRQNVRDVAFQKLRDVTIAIAIAAAAGVGLIAWVSAATIPGSTAGSDNIGGATAGVDDRQSTSGSGFVQAPPRKARLGPGVAVSGGSR